MVYNCRDDTELEGSTLIGAGPGARAKGWRVVTLLVLAALVAAILAGCGGAGSGGSSQSSEKQQASRTGGSSGQKPDDEGLSKQTSEGRLGHPALGSADAPVVLIEYSDYQ